LGGDDFPPPQRFTSKSFQNPLKVHLKVPLKVHLKGFSHDLVVIPSLRKSSKNTNMGPSGGIFRKTEIAFKKIFRQIEREKPSSEIERGF
jgi:hypothetical protein